MGGSGGAGWLGIGLMLFFGLLVLIGIVLLIVWLARGPGGEHGRYGGGAGYGRRDSAIELARERYARGEITREELERIEHDLRR